MPLMCFVDHHDRIARLQQRNQEQQRQYDKTCKNAKTYQQRIDHDLAQQQAVGDEFDLRELVVAAVIEPHSVADFGAEHATDLLRHTLRQRRRGDSPRLRSDENKTSCVVTKKFR